ncbi:MAG: aminotransferase class V-fold PLP-dependent enzyme [bacterium]
MARRRNKSGVGSASQLIQRYIAVSEEPYQKREVDLTVNSFNNESVFAARYEINNELNSIPTPIIDAFENYLHNASVPLHIPGHARGEGVFPKFRDLVGDKIVCLDTTDEFDGLGTLHPATGPIEKGQELFAQLYGASKSFFLVNGSTVGNLALALTITQENKKVIVSRNCHRSVVSGLTMSGANPIWIMPELLEDWGVYGHISPREVKRLLDENPDVTAVWITNPTYEGIASDIKSIAAICKERDIYFIVDEAHGCLWKFHDQLPFSALDCGADAVVHSIHKTGGSFSQSSVLHLGKNSKINSEALESNLKMMHSTSPSYMLLASLDSARAYLSSSYGMNKVNDAVNNALKVRERLSNVPRVKCLNSTENINIDPTKIYITIEGLSGKRLESILEFEYQIEVEAATDNGILALSNIGNTEKELDYFTECIIKIAQNNYHDLSYLENTKYMPFHTPETVYTPRQAFTKQKEKIAVDYSIGRISAEVIALCPPGIPVLIPGERITEEHLPYLTMINGINVLKEH